MCGIAGIINTDFSRTQLENCVKAMTDSISHRGPDGDGLWISDDGKIGLGHRRLKILDLSHAAAQPMTCTEKKIWITYNGEIYNHQDIRNELVKKGYKFKSTSDTETIIYAYKEWGIECLNKFNGMFAFGLWDGYKNKLYLVRDRIGVKPVYYSFINNSLVFASELKAILKYPSMQRKLSQKGFYHYLTFGSLPAPFTLIENVNKLPAGNYIEWDLNSDFKIVEWWNPLWNTYSHPEFSSEAEFEEYLIELLNDSVKIRMLSDVPYGAFLSGGVDSGLITALMTRNNNKPVDTYTIEMENNNENSELKYANLVSDKFNTNHFIRYVTDKDFEEYFLNSYATIDEPISTQDFMAIHHISKASRDNGTIVIQSGEGSDELFMGYQGLDKILKSYNGKHKAFSSLPSVIRKNISGYFYSKNRNNSDNLYNAAHGRHYYWTLHNIFGEMEKRNLIKGKQFSEFDSVEVLDNVHSLMHSSDEKLSMDKVILFTELKTRLPELLLMRVDRVGMANSIELRVPFLDYRIVEFAFKIPLKYKIKKSIHKYILKKVSEKYLPEEIIYRKKMGFCGSIKHIMTPQLIEFTEKTIKNELSEYDDILNINHINYLFENLDKGNNYSKVWSLLNFSLWKKNWLCK